MWHIMEALVKFLEVFSLNYFNFKLNFFNFLSQFFFVQ